MKAQKALGAQKAASAFSQAVDRIGNIKAQVAALQAEYDTLKATLIAGGNPSYDGELYRVQFVETDRSTLDMKAVREKLSPQFIAAHTRTTHVVQMHVSAHSASNVIPIK